MAENDAAVDPFLDGLPDRASSKGRLVEPSGLACPAPGGALCFNRSHHDGCICAAQQACELGGVGHRLISEAVV
jgi:hypothetical protein